MGSNASASPPILSGFGKPALDKSQGQQRGGLRQRGPRRWAEGSRGSDPKISDQETADLTVTLDEWPGHRPTKRSRLEEIVRGELPVFSQTFEDIEILASSHPLIDMHYRQADRGAFQGSILAFALPHGLIWWSQANLGGPGIGIIPEGYLMVAICARGQEESWHGRPTQIGAATSELGLHHRAAANHDAICWMLEWDYVLPLAERMG